MNLKELLERLQKIEGRQDYKVRIEHTGGFQDNPPSSDVHGVEVDDEWKEVSILC